MVNKVRKRDGRIVDFDFNKIIEAVKKAFESQGENYHEELAKTIYGNFELFDDEKIISIETIQDEVENILMDCGYNKVAKAYILYRERHNESRFIKERIDYMDRYSMSGDNAATSSETDSNANVTMKNVANLEGEVYKTTNRIIQDCVKSYGLHGGWKENTSFIRDRLVDILQRVYKYHIAFKTMLYDMEDKKMFAASNGGYIYVNKLYSTIGINGLNEAARFLGLEVSNNPEYIAFLQLILGTIKEENKKHSIHDKKRPFLFNSEVVPAEGLGGKNYEWDKADGYWVPDDENLYNSYFYEAHDNTSVLDKFMLHGNQTYQYTDGGSAAHINLEEHLSKQQYLKLIDFAISNGTSYFTFNIPNSKCESCGKIVKQPISQCPCCGGTDITQYTRIIGYLRPIKNFGIERQIEAGKRVYSKGI